jgi:osmotically-inducible protein OsmY
VHQVPRGNTILSLAQVSRDDSVMIGHIAFEAIRERCPAPAPEQWRATIVNFPDLPFSPVSGESTMKSDTQIQKDVIDELQWDPSVRDTEIGVAAKDGIVTLSGQVDSYAEKCAAERAAQRVSGVRAIADDLTVRLPESYARSDTEIAHAAIAALDWDIQVPDESVTAKVDNGWINLSGTVEWKYQRDAAERAVRYLTGVKGVSNLIQLRPKGPSTMEVTRKIKSALHRAVERDAKRITVEAADGHVTLSGTVRSLAERQDAESAAWSAPGVTSVEDRITVVF